MKVNFNGIGDKTVTFKAGAVTEGAVCKVTANGTVAACSSGDSFAGVARHVRAGYTDVQLGGYALVSYTGSTAPTLGWCGLSANGNGGVSADAKGRQYLVVEMDTTNSILGVFLG